MRQSFLVMAVFAGVAMFGARGAEANSSTPAPNTARGAKPVLVGAPAQPTPTPMPTPVPLSSQNTLQYAQFQDGCAGTGLDASACLASLGDGKLVFVGGFVAMGAGYVTPKRYGLFKTSRSAGSTVQAATQGWGGDTLIASGALAPTKVTTVSGHYTLPGFLKLLPVAVHDCLTVRWFADDVAPDAAQSAPTPPQCRTWSGLPATTTTYTIDNTDWQVGQFSTPSQTGARWQTADCNPAANLYVSPNGQGAVYQKTPAVYELTNTVGTTYTPVPACPGGTAYVQYSMGYHFSNVQTGYGILRMRVTAAKPIPCAGKIFVTINGGERQRYFIDGSKKLDEIVDRNDGLWSPHLDGPEGVMVEVLPPDGTTMCPSAAVDPKLEVTTLNGITTIPGLGN